MRPTMKGGETCVTCAILQRSALRAGRTLLPINNFFSSVSGTHLCYKLSKRQSLVWLEGVDQLS
jgi:hypothetical protein